MTAPNIAMEPTAQRLSRARRGSSQPLGRRDSMAHHVFIDNSNIFGGAQSMSARVEKHVPWPALRVHFRNLALLVEGGQEVGSRVLAGSVPPGNDDLWNYARDMKYETNLLRKVEKDDGRLGEQGVDELLHLKIANLLLDSDDAQALVLVTGDGRVSQFGTGFALQAERALKRGWQVEIWSWKSALSPAFGKLATTHGGKIRIPPVPIICETTSRARLV